VETAKVKLTGFFAGVSESADKPELQPENFMGAATSTFQQMITYAALCGKKCTCPKSKQKVSENPIPRTLDEFKSWVKGWYFQKYHKELK
jgi:hypothetical protein